MIAPALRWNKPTYVLMTSTGRVPRGQKKPAMVKVYSSMLVGQAELIRAGLESAGIRVFRLGQDLQGLVGEVPFVEATCDLYVDVEQADDARAIVASMEQHAASQPDWTCPQCQERIDGVFTECWKCSAGAEEQPE